MTDVDAPTTPEMDVIHDDADAPAGPTGDADHDEHDEPSDAQYVVVAAILACITALEVAASYIDLGPFFLPALLGMMAVKFIIVVRIFMHLKFDNRVFSWLFYTGLLLALAVYLTALATFRFFSL